MVKKNRFVNIALVLILLLLLTACCMKQGRQSRRAVWRETENSSKATEVVIETEQETEETENKRTEYREKQHYDAFETAVGQLLKTKSSAFFEHYPVDEAFFTWLEAKYGEGTVSQIAANQSGLTGDSELWYQVTGCTMHVLWLEFCKEHQFQTYRLEHVTWRDSAKDKQVTIDFVGDINFDPTWYTMKYAKKQGGVKQCISYELRKELQSADITMVNNEFCYTKEKEKQKDKAYCFKAAPDKVQLLSLFGTDIVSLANNHTCDYGEKGLLDTMDTLRENGIVYSGAGRKLEEASAVQYFVSGGRKIAFVSATEIERFYHYTQKAGENSPGVLKTQQKKVLLAALKEARRNSDYVILFVHWGAEGKIKQDSEQRTLAQEYVDAGVDAIIGSHPHRLQGVQVRDKVPIVYSLGNFWFSTGTLYATVAQIRIDEAGELKLRLIPCLQNGCKTTLLNRDESRKGFYQYVADLSEEVQIDSDGWISELIDDGTRDVYTSGRRYGQHFDNADLKLRPIDIVGNLQ